MGMKTREPESDSFVAALGKRLARGEYDARPNLTPKALEELAYEAWWNVALYDCENEGVDVDDDDVQAEFSGAFVAEYGRLKSAGGTGARWTMPALADMRARLVAAGVPDDRLERLDGFISDASLDDEDTAGLAQFCELFEYVHGLRESFPTRWEGGRPYFEVDEDEWKLLFGPVREWGEVERRLCRWIWQLPVQKNQLGKSIVYDLLPDEIRAHPNDDVFGIARALLLELGEIDDPILSHSVERFMYAAVTDSDEMTSFGRYILDVGFDRVWPVAVNKRRVSYYADLLLLHARDVFDANAARFDDAIADSDAWKLDLAETMLRCDADAYRDKVLQWAASIDSPSLCSHMAIYLCWTYGDRDKALVLSLTDKAITGFGDEDGSAAAPLHRAELLAPFAEYPNSSVKLCLVATVLDAFGAEAFDAVAGYRYRNEGWMIRYYELLGRFLPGHAGARDIMVRGLMKELPDHLGGELRYRGYVQRLCAALASFDLAGDRAAIEARFAGATDPKITAAIASLW